jgi:hypothetical protein
MQVAAAIGDARPRGATDAATRAYLEKTRASLRGSILTALHRARHSLRFYDAAFASLIDGKPQGFRDFLLEAPTMFCELGERLGAVNHVVSFWNFRFPKGQLPVVSGPELMDIFSDFETNLAFQER